MVGQLRVVGSTPGAAPAAWDVSRALQPLTSSCCSACRPLAAGTPMGLIVDDRGSRPAVDPPQTGTPGVPVCGRSTTGCRRRTKVRACPRSSHGTPALACAMCTYSLPRASLDRAQATGGGHRPEPPPLPPSAAALVGRPRRGRRCRARWCGHRRHAAAAAATQPPPPPQAQQQQQRQSPPPPPPPQQQQQPLASFAHQHAVCIGSLGP